MDGKEVVQLYVEDVYSSIVTPNRELKAFKKVLIIKDEKITLNMSLNFDSFKLLNKDFEWVIEPGEFKIYIGSSSDDIQLQGTIDIK